MRRVVLIAALLILVGGGVWLARRGSSTKPASSELERRTAPAADAPAALPEGAAVPETRLAPAPGAGAPSSSAAPPASPPPGAVEVQVIPDDPVEHGQATLALSVLDEATGAPQSGTVHLWRLDAPGNADWLEGDQLQGMLWIAEGRGERAELPEGRYRAVFEEQRGVADDPAMFEVRGARSEVTLRVPMPRRFPGSLRLLDERGAPLQEAETNAMSFGYTRIVAAPAWVRMRALRSPSGFAGLGGGGGGARQGTSQRARITAANDLLPVGEFAEPSRGRLYRQRLRIRTTDRSDVILVLGNGATAPTTHVGVALPLALLLDHVVLPDGAPVLGSSARITAQCDAELLTPETPPDRWRTLAIHVTVRVEGYDPLEVTADADHPSPLPPPWKRVAEKPPQTPR